MRSNVKLTVPPRAELLYWYRDQNKTFREMTEIYGGISAATLTKWFKIHEITTSKVLTKVISGKVHRRCNGQFHNGRYVPIEQFTKNKHKPTGTDARCKKCSGVAGRVPFTPQYEAWLESIVRRLGWCETVRRLEISERTLLSWQGKDCKPKPKTIFRQHAVKLVEIIAELKATGEVRHRLSIRRGSAIRGEKERKVNHGSNLYVPTSDLDTQQRNKIRKQFAEREKEYSRNYNVRRKELRIARKEAKQAKAEKAAELTKTEAA